MNINPGCKGIRNVLLHFAFLLASLSMISFADAADWRNLVQPIGTENDPFLNDPAVLNALYSAGKGPWDTGTSVTSIKTTVPQFFIRFYNPTAVQNSSRQEGSWIMRTSTVRGLNAQQIRDLFALPNTPTMMTLGLSSTGASLYTGIAGPIAGWGTGGGQQSQSYSGPYTTFFNGQTIQDRVLYYPSMAGTPNLSAIGSYLVAHNPAPYSDMESVYNSLDVLYNPASSDLFNKALKSITPAGFDNLATISTRAVLAQNQTIDDRIDQLSHCNTQTGIWTKGIKTHQQYSTAGFDSDVNGVIIGADTKTSNSAFSGLSLAWLQGTVNWYDNGGKATSDYYRVAAYTALVMDKAFLQATVSAGSADGQSSRNIYIDTFYQPSPYSSKVSPLAALSRTAQGCYTAWNADLNLRGGALLHAGPLTILPATSIGYLYQSQGSFNETGAGSLDLNVSDIQSQLFHCQADIRIDREFLLGEHEKITPYLSVGWAYEKRIDNQAVTASMNSWNDSFTTYSPLSDRQSFTGKAGLMISTGKQLLIHADYIFQTASGYSNDGIEGGISWAF